MFEIASLFEPEKLVTEDPWGFGYKFEHVAADDPDFVDWRRQQPVSPLAQELQQRIRTEMSREMLSAARSSNGSGMAASPEMLSEVRDKVFRELSETWEGSPEDDVPANEAEGVALLVKGWSGVLNHKGAEVEFSRKMVLELLQNRALVPAKHPKTGEPLEFAGSQVGQVLCAQILETAQGAVILNSAALATAEDLSEASTDGA